MGFCAAGVRKKRPGEFLVTSARIRAAEDEEAENRGSVLGDFGVWLGLGDPYQGGNESIRKEIGPKCLTNKENFGLFFF